MAHFAKIENNQVTTVVVVADEHENNATEFLASIGEFGEFVQTSYNHRIRKKFAAIGDVYNRELDRFEPPQRYQSWVWNEEEYCYLPPVPFPPSGDKHWKWNEEEQTWNEDTFGN